LRRTDGGSTRRRRRPDRLPPVLDLEAGHRGALRDLYAAPRGDPREEAPAAGEGTPDPQPAGSLADPFRPGDAALLSDAEHARGASSGLGPRLRAPPRRLEGHFRGLRGPSLLRNREKVLRDTP